MENRIPVRTIESKENDSITSVINRTSVVLTVFADNNDEGGDALVTSRKEDDDY